MNMLLDDLKASLLDFFDNHSNLYYILSKTIIMIIL